MKMKKSKTSRGFTLIEFDDSYGYKYTLQESSNIVTRHIWLGARDQELDVQEWVDGQGWVKYQLPEQFVSNSRMHLTRMQSLHLGIKLIWFAITGKL